MSPAEQKVALLAKHRASTMWATSSGRPVPAWFDGYGQFPPLEACALLERQALTWLMFGNPDAPRRPMCGLMSFVSSRASSSASLTPESWEAALLRIRNDGPSYGRRSPWRWVAGS